MITKFKKENIKILSQGMTLIELLLYLALFSILFSGFITFTFEFSRTVGLYSGKEDDERVERIIGEFIRWHVHHTETLVTPAENASSTLLELDPGGGLPRIKITETEIGRLFRFDQHISLSGVSFYRSNVLKTSFKLNAAEHTFDLSLL